MEIELNISKTLIYRILTERLGLQKVCARFVPHKLTDVQKLLRTQHSKDIIKEAKKDPNFLYKIVTGDEAWCFQYDPETKRQSAEWKAPDEPKSAFADERKALCRRRGHSKGLHRHAGGHTGQRAKTLVRHAFGP